MWHVCGRAAYSTVEDLLHFANALEQNKLLNGHNTELLTTGKIDTPMSRYGYGFADRTVTGARCFGHGGRRTGNERRPSDLSGTGIRNRRTG
jgi:hypothetical protein